MNCHFCHVETKTTNVVGANIHQQCLQCLTKYIYYQNSLNTVLESIDLWTTIRETPYLVRLKPIISYTEIYRIATDKHGQHYQIVKTVCKLMPVTPQNVTDKVKTILMFQ